MNIGSSKYGYSYLDNPRVIQSISRVTTVTLSCLHTLLLSMIVISKLKLNYNDPQFALPSERF